MTAKLTNHCTCTYLTTNTEKWKYAHSLYNTKSDMIDDMVKFNLFACLQDNKYWRKSNYYLQQNILKKKHDKQTKAFTADLHANVKDK